MTLPPSGQGSVPPPAAAPPAVYKRTLMDRLGPDGAMMMRARVVSVLAFIVTFPLAAVASQTRALTAPHPILTGLVGASLAAALMYFMMERLPAAAGAGALAVTAATGISTPYEPQFSREDALAARGDVAGALAAYEEVIAAHPQAIPPRIRAAELYAARGANPRRAAELFREIRAIPGVTNRDAVYACSRLADLYDGSLNDPGRALVELRRIIELYPGTPVAAHARAALPRLKERLADSPP